MGNIVGFLQYFLYHMIWNLTDCFIQRHAMQGKVNFQLLKMNVTHRYQPDLIVLMLNSTECSQKLEDVEQNRV